jgi:oligopeptidase B
VNTVTGTIIAASLLSAADTAPPKNMQPPIAAVRPHVIEKHNQRRTDNYYWLRERGNPEVIAYLEAENRYLDATLAHAKELRQTLFSEFRSRIKQTDETVPYRKDGYEYYSRTESGKNYPILCRRKAGADSPEEILVDGNKAAEGHRFFSLGPVQVSPDTKLLAWGADTTGRRFYTIRFRNLATGEELTDVLRDVTPEVEWAAGNGAVYYAKQDPETLRAYQIYRHVLGSNPAEDKLIYAEKDTEFSVGLSKTKSKKYILIESHQTLTTEYRYIDAADPAARVRVFTPRVRGHEYHVDHANDRFWIRSNEAAPNFRLFSTAVGSTERANWQEVIPHRTDTLLFDMEFFRDFMVLTERRNGLTQLRVRPWSGDGDHYIDFGEPTYAASLGQNYELDTARVRFRYSSLTTPNSTYDYDTAAKQKILLKRDEVLAGFDPANYAAERLYATAEDGVKVPVSVVYRKGAPLDGKRPLLQYAYGSYGYSTDANFNPFVISLLDRGFVYAIAHIRGGQEMGRQWYEDGKLLKKKNTFKDFISVTEHLVKHKYADPKRVYAMGGSAGGLLMGAVMNMRPDLYHGMIAAVPFVDVVTTMLDDTIPLTTFEYDEWGNPNDQTYFEYMLSYSPYDRVEAKKYPNLLVTAGLHDSQVQYWEPAKWVAKLRAVNKDSNRLLLYTNMDAGHGGASARYKRYEELALQYAFLLDLAGVRN